MSHETPDVSKYQKPGAFIGWREVWQVLPLTLAGGLIGWGILALIMLVLS